MPCPLSLAEMASRRGLQILQFNAKKRLDSFHYIFIPFHPFFPFDLPLPTSQLSIICSGFLVPGRTGFHHVVHADDRDADYDVGGVE